MSLSVFAPISIGNLNVGFDSLGLALAPIDGSLVGDIVTIERLTPQARQHEFTLAGTHADKLPQDKESNIAWHCLNAFHHALKQHAIEPQMLKVTLFKNIPVSSGLGSSACSVVATLVALNLFYSRPFDDQKLLTMMAQQEGQFSGSIHYDNVAPSFLGGLQLILTTADKTTQSLPTFNDCFWVLAYPDIEVTTMSAREILPQHYDQKTLVQFGQNLAGFIDASHRQDLSQAFALLTDVVAEPYRAKLLPNFKLAKKSLSDLGCLASGISGSGPSLFCVCHSQQIAETCAHWLNENYLQTKNGFVQICKIDHLGARQL